MRYKYSCLIILLLLFLLLFTPLQGHCHTLRGLFDRLYHLIK
uniref:Uncharacterized protein n=1 Tax=Siphoviridae sp. ctTfn5 TaxID=2827878 RepID=A0A8S5THB0_9CAUD|nr:MAG TPA: hypothetical protein [Siphoviridae sp. ctTfn5]